MHKHLSKEYEKRYRYEFSIIFQNFWNSKLLAESSNKTSSRVVLDLGCGNGVLLRDLKQIYNFPLGIDVSFEMVKNIKSQCGEDTKLLVGDGLNLPLKAESLDIIICRGVLHHFFSVKKGLREIRRCLKKDGILVFSEPSNDSRIIKTARFILYKFSKKFDEADAGFQRKLIIDELEKAGFAVENFLRFGMFAYILAGFPDHFPILKYVPFNTHITRILIHLDEICARLPLINILCFQLLIRAKKV